MNKNIDYSDILNKLKLTQQDLNESNENENENRKARRGLNVLQMVLWFLGFGLIIYNTNLFVGFGIWFLIWSNNINLTRAILGKTKEKMENIWKDK